MFKNILVAVDGSPAAHKAVEVVASLASQSAGSITVLHVLPRAGSAVVPEELAPYLTAEHIQMTEADFLRSSAEEIVENEAAFLRSQGHKKVERYVEIGDPAHTIIQYATSHGVDVIVIGSRGRSDLAQLMLGSVSHKVAQLSPCTCITVR